MTNDRLFILMVYHAHHFPHTIWDFCMRRMFSTQFITTAANENIVRIDNDVVRFARFTQYNRMKIHFTDILVTLNRTGAFNGVVSHCNMSNHITHLLSAEILRLKLIEKMFKAKIA